MKNIIICGEHVIDRSIGKSILMIFLHRLKFSQSLEKNNVGLPLLLISTNHTYITHSTNGIYKRSREVVIEIIAIIGLSEVTASFRQWI